MIDWIKCSDELPEECEMVLTYSSKRGCRLLWRNQGRWESDEFYGYANIDYWAYITVPKGCEPNAV